MAWADSDSEPEGEPVHPAAHLGRHAVKMFEEVVEHTTVRKRASKTSDLLVNEGLLYDRLVGTDDYSQDLFEFSARLEAWEQYSRYLDAIEPTEQPDLISPTPR